MKKLLIIVLGLLLTGCVAQKNFQLDDKKLTENIFSTTQEPKFEMETAGLKYLGSIDESTGESALRYRAYSHFFTGKDYIIVISMVTLNTGEWMVHKPWELQLEKEKHGKKVFDCGIEYKTITLAKNDILVVKGGLPPKIGQTYTAKIWIYSPGGITGGTRIYLNYYESGNHKNNLQGFIERADTRTKFKML